MAIWGAVMHLGGSNLVKIHNFGFRWLLAGPLPNLATRGLYICLCDCKCDSKWDCKCDAHELISGVFTSASVQNSHFWNSQIGLETVTLVLSSLKCSVTSSHTFMVKYKLPYLHQLHFWVTRGISVKIKPMWLFSDQCDCFKSDSFCVNFDCF